MTSLSLPATSAFIIPSDGNLSISLLICEKVWKLWSIFCPHPQQLVSKWPMDGANGTRRGENMWKLLRWGIWEISRPSPRGEADAMVEDTWWWWWWPCDPVVARDCPGGPGLVSASSHLIGQDLPLARPSGGTRAHSTANDHV